MNARLFAVAAACLTLPLLATAQGPQPLHLPSFPDLKEHATESVDITLGWMPLHLMGWFLDDGDPDTAQMKQTLKGLKSVQIRSYQFNSDYAYPQADIDRVRAQLAAPGWSPLVQVRKRGASEGQDKENVDIYVALEDKKVRGLVIIACEPRELTIVNIVGSLDLEQIAGLRKSFVPPGKGLGQVPPQA
ncbi:MAG TPA: DUF4252 domain-containing protein [Steroidobacteraceae bacterium]|nr:DUF4252 domain-containing protein [Gammaproteobacteria bacterium]HEV2285964.1 DUF4252 domain-containing protein [Steroidobacteraceae bacterium]